MTIAQFVEKLIDEKFVDRKPEGEIRQQITTELTDRLNQYLTLRTIEAISTAKPEAVKELAVLIESKPTAQQVQEFVSGHIDNPDVLVSHILADFRALYLGINEETKAN